LQLKSRFPCSRPPRRFKRFDRLARSDGQEKEQVAAWRAKIAIMKKHAAKQQASYARALAALDRERACATVAGLDALFAAEGMAAVPRQMFISELKVVQQQFLDPR
jgi:hypothetical protein